MAKISLKKVVSDVKDAYVSASGDTDEITYGNVAEKIKQASSPYIVGNIVLDADFVGVIDRPFFGSIDIEGEK